MLDPKLLQLFVLLAQERHFGRAAARANLSQSSVSAQVRRLEDVVGTPLFTRHKRAAVQLTETGLQFLPEAIETLDRLSRTEAMARALARGEAGTVTLGYIFSAVPSGVLPGLLNSVRAAAPLLHVVPRQAETPEQIAAVAERRLDLALVRPRPSYPAGVTALIVHSEPLHLLLSADHPLARHEQVPAGELAAQTFLLPQFNERVGLLVKLERLAAEGGFAMPQVVKTGDFVSAASMAAAGYGVVLAPASLMRLGVDRLVARRITGFTDRIETALLWREDGAPAARRIAATADRNLARDQKR